MGLLTAVDLSSTKHRTACPAHNYACGMNKPWKVKSIPLERLLGNLCIEMCYVDCRGRRDILVKGL